MIEDYELPARMCWTVRRNPASPRDMQWFASWPTGLTLYAATYERIWERMREECLERAGVRL